MVYYVEVNLIAITVGLLLLYSAKNMTSNRETSQIVLNLMLWTLILFSLSDMLAYFFRGKSYIGAEITNIVFFILMAVGSYLWYLYICVKMGQYKDLKRHMLISSIPIVLLCVAILFNPLTGYFFTIDSNNIYHRGKGVILTWIVEWMYVIFATVVNIKAIVNENKTYRKHEYKGYLFFFAPIALAAIVQMFFYGVTSSQIGYMIALLMAFCNRQFHLVQKDELTGLNNKNALLSYRDYIDNSVKDLKLTLFMMDADNFKSINDLYGHLKGDQALKDIADILRSAAGDFTNKRVILYRYGGDEFIIIGNDMTDDEIEHIKELIYARVDKMNEKNKKAGESYVLGLSIGHASAECNDTDEFDNLMKAADEAMYLVKKERSVGR